MSYERIPLEEFADTLGTKTELSSVALGSQVLAVSDEFFAEAFHLLKVEPAPSLKGQFGPKGALYSGWETRRHNPDYDWCIIKLGALGIIDGFDIDTSHFSGNEAPEVSVQALFSNRPEVPASDDPQWTEILPRVKLGPNARHLFTITTTPKSFSHVKLNMYPDGGIARFRVYGTVLPTIPDDPNESFDLAHVFSGGRVVFTSDQHFGVGSNLLLPGRGKDMGDGWETKRSRTPGHKDWAIIKLGPIGFLEVAEIDTAHFKGNFPESCELHATHSDLDIPPTDEEKWTCILPRTKLGPHRRHFFQLENVQQIAFTHVRVTIYPDGGIKRVRLVGKDVSASSEGSTSKIMASSLEGKELAEEDTNDVPSSENPESLSESSTSERTIHAVPLTLEAFAPFGQVIQAWSDIHAVPRQINVTSANQGSANKFHKLALIESSYPAASGATPGLSVYRCEPLDITPGGKEDWTIKLLERHPYTNQAFIPMGSGAGLSDDALGREGRAYLVVVAQNGGDDKPDLSTLRAFVANSAQGIMYRTGIWHHPMVSLETTIDFTCVETQIGNGDRADCEILELDGFAEKGLPGVKIAKF